MERGLLVDLRFQCSTVFGRKQVDLTPNLAKLEKITQKNKQFKQINQYFKTTDLNSLNCLELDYGTVSRYIDELPFKVGESWRNAVAHHIRHFGFEKVKVWAAAAASKREPERYFMTILRRQRYGN